MKRAFHLLAIFLLLHSGLCAQRDLSDINEGSTPVCIEFFAGTNCTFLRTNNYNRNNLHNVSPQFAYEGGALVRRNYDEFHRFSVQSGVQLSRQVAYADYSYIMGSADQPVYGRTTQILRYDSWQVGIPLEALIIPRKKSRLRFTAGLCASFAFDAKSYWLYTVFYCPMQYSPSRGTYYDPSSAITYLESGTIMWKGLFASATGSVEVLAGKLFGHPTAISFRYSYGLNEVSMDPHFIQSSASLRFHFML
jgi:hypothetical protein